MCNTGLESCITACTIIDSCIYMQRQTAREHKHKKQVPQDGQGWLVARPMKHVKVGY